MQVVKKKRHRKPIYTVSFKGEAYEDMGEGQYLESVCCYAPVLVLRKLADSSIITQCSICKKECELVGDR